METNLTNKIAVVTGASRGIGLATVKALAAAPGPHAALPAATGRARIQDADLGLVAADEILIPVQTEYYALEGLGKLLNTIKSVQKIHNPSLDIEGLLLTMYDSRLRLSNQVVEEVQKHFNDMVFETIIQRNVKLSEAPSFGESIINYDATSKGDRKSVV